MLPALSFLFKFIIKVLKNITLITNVAVHNADIIFIFTSIVVAFFSSFEIQDFGTINDKYSFM